MTQAFNLSQFANKLNSSGATDNTGLQNSSVTVTAGTGLSGGGAVALGSSVTLNNAGVTSVTAGTGISVSASTGGVTISASSGGANIQSCLALRTSAINSNGTPLVYSGTAGTLTFTPPTGVTKVAITIFGGGGAGGGSNSCYDGGSGGYGGFGYGYYTVTPGTAYTVTVGVGGTANGGAGGTSSFGALITATGGAGGTNASGSGNGVTGANGSASNGTIRNVSAAAGGTLFGGGSQAIGVTSPLVWAINATYGAGNSGTAYSNAAGAGGVSGLVYIEYVG